MPIPKSASGEMPFLDHLEELRWRIIYSLAAVVICVGIGFWLSIQYDIVGLLARPILPLIPEHKLVYTHPSEGFTVILNAAMTFGFVIAAPVVIYQAWAFLAPALRIHERRVGVGVLFSGVLLFISGAALAYFVVVPLALPWLFAFGGPSLVPLITAEEYFSFIFAMVLTFGVSFELPISILGPLGARYRDAGVPVEVPAARDRADRYHRCVSDTGRHGLDDDRAVGSALRAL